MLIFNEYTTLDKIKSGEKVLITKILDPEVKCMSSRIGFDEGEDLICLSHTPGGPVIIQKNFQEIALGMNLSKKIQVQLI